MSRMRVITPKVYKTVKKDIALGKFTLSQIAARNEIGQSTVSVIKKSKNYTDYKKIIRQRILSASKPTLKEQKVAEFEKFLAKQEKRAVFLQSLTDALFIILGLSLLIYIIWG